MPYFCYNNKKSANLIFIILCLLILTLAVNSLEEYNSKLASYSAEFDINEGYLNNKIEMVLEYTDGKDFGLRLPKKFSNLSLHIDGKIKNNTILEKREKKILVVPLSRHTKNITLNFLIKGNLNKLELDYYLGTVIAPFDSRLFNVKIVLPDGAILAKSIQEEGAIDPKPKLLETDGQRISMIWQYADVKKGFKVTNFVPFKDKDKKDYSSWVLYLLAFIITLFVVMLVLKKYKKQKDEIENHLKGNEKEVVRVLKLKGGKTSQATLRIATGFPKSTLSDLLKELEERKIISKRIKGRKNIIVLNNSQSNFIEQKEG